MGSTASSCGEVPKETDTNPVFLIHNSVKNNYITNEEALRRLKTLPDDEPGFARYLFTHFDDVCLKYIWDRIPLEGKINYICAHYNQYKTAICKKWNAWAFWGIEIDQLQPIVSTQNVIMQRIPKVIRSSPELQVFYKATLMQRTIMITQMEWNFDMAVGNIIRHPERYISTS